MPGMPGQPQPQVPQEEFLTFAPEVFASQSGRDLGVRISINASEPETRQFRVQESQMTLQTFGQLGMPLTHPILEEAMLELADALNVGHQVCQTGQHVAAGQGGGGGAPSGAAGARPGQASPPRPRQLQKPVGGPGASAGPRVAG